MCKNPGAWTGDMKPKAWGGQISCTEGVNHWVDTQGYRSNREEMCDPKRSFTLVGFNNQKVTFQDFAIAVASDCCKDKQSACTKGALSVRRCLAFPWGRAEWGVRGRPSQC